MSWIRFTGAVVLVAAGAATVWAVERSQEPVRPGPSAPPSASAESNPADGAADRQRLVATRQLAFTIPFSVSAARDPDSSPVEVQLFVSVDKGVNWLLSARQQPSAGRFQFHAPRDGTYCFLVRTVDRSGQVRPPGPMRPELRVLVDTAPPLVDFEATAGSRGEIVTRWSVTDAQLLPETFTLEYKTGAGDKWQSVAINRRSAGNSTTRLVGTEIWWPNAAGKAVALRAQVRDAAGNAAVVNRHVQLPNIATWTPRKPAESTEPDDEPRYPRAESPIHPPVAGQVPPVGGSRVPAGGSTPVGNDRTTTGVRMKPLTGNTPADAARPQSPVEWPADNRPQPPDRTTQAAPTGTPARPASHDSGSGDVRPADESVPAAAPNAGQARMIASRRFNMEYDVEQVGPGGLVKVALWITRDGGQSWQALAIDDDKRSPIAVEMQEDGVFGYRLVLHGADGMTGHVPRAGDAADVWVGIDTTHPTVRIASARYGNGRELGQLEITWQTEDQRLADRPITLQFSGSADGPWSTIAAGLADTGRYVWQADNRVPRELYLRIEARDAAGNVGSFQLTEPINTAALVPAGRIRAIQPADNVDLGAVRQRRYR